MKLYYAPGACSVGIHVLLEEIGKPYQAEAVDLRGGAQYKPPYTSINPKSKVPTLERDDGSVLTEFPVIAHWLARHNPQAGLLPKDDEVLTRAEEAMEYVVGTMHGQGFGRLFRPTNFSSNEAEQEKVKARGREIAENGFALMDKALAGKDYLGGQFSVADAALFYTEFWAAKRLGMPLPKNVAAHFARMLARPAVQRVMQQEGLG
ncbi:MAG TPA: glutathione S-transferase C-terminal domain-containing protein [Stellaceae bacterium]|nr:glutathione S-transferase C-terminal domain-containing protein [Stellaceae bacterium]